MLLEPNQLAVGGSTRLYKSYVLLDKHKVRLVVKGFAQKEIINYYETFGYTTKWVIVHDLLALATRNRLKVHHMDVKTTFLHSDLKDNIYMS